MISAQVEDAIAPRALPVTFGPGGEQMFGWFHAPAAGSGMIRDCFVVMCSPPGYDDIRTYRHYRLLARQLANRGFPVLRYDHHGTGNSTGSDEDPDRLQTWLDGVDSAVAFTRTLCSATRAVLFGVRMGGTLALAAANRHQLAEMVIAWAPFQSGKTYLREMRALREMRDVDASSPPVVHDTGADSGEEAAGYLLTASTVAALETLSLVAVTSRPAAEILLLARDDLPGNDKLARHLIRIGCDVTQTKTPGYAGMMQDTFNSVVPETAFAEIVAWLEQRSPLRPALPVVVDESMPAHFVAGNRGAEAQVVETPVSFGVDGRLFGIVSTASKPQKERGSTGVILVSVGSNHHVGPNRMYVTQARAFAALGFVAMRIDIGGVGESPPLEGHRDNHLYAMHSVADVHSAMDFLCKQYALKQVVLVGVCSGAYLSFHAADHPATASVVLINPQTFNWREGDSLELRVSRSIKSMRFYRARLFDPGTWKRAIAGQLHLGVLIPELSKILGRSLLHFWHAVSGRNTGNVQDGSQFDVAQRFKTFLSRGIHIALVYSADDGGLNEMTARLGSNASAVRKYKKFALQIVEGADHTFTPLWAQRRLLDLLTQHLIRLYG